MGLAAGAMNDFGHALESRAIRMTASPLRASARAVASPMPLDAPVTSANPAVRVVMVTFRPFCASLAILREPECRSLRCGLYWKRSSAARRPEGPRDCK
jgi:hypothetical protein